MLRNYIKIAWRNLWKNKAFSIINITGLAIGISTCLVIFLLANFELSFENFQEDKERIYRITSNFSQADGSKYYNSGLSAPMPFAIRNEISGLESIAAIHSINPKIQVLDLNNTKSEIYNNNDGQVIICEPEYFQVFKYEWLDGSPNTALQNPNEVVLTEASVMRYFGNITANEALGKQLIFSDTLYATVTGVVKDYPKNSDFKFQLFLSFKTIETVTGRDKFQLEEWESTNSSSLAYVKLLKGISAEEINTQFEGFLLKNLDQNIEWNIGRGLKLQALSDIHFNDRYGGNHVRLAHLPTLYSLIGIAAFLLLIAAINFINLSTAQSINRIKEIGVRKVLGGNRKSLILQFLSETFIITLVAVFLSILLVNPILTAYENFVPKDLSFDLLSPITITFLVLITLVTALLSGLYPSWIISSYSPIASLNNHFKNGRSKTVFLRKALITFQFTTSQVFILGTIIVSQQSNFLLNKDLGFEKDAIVSIYTDWNELQSGKKDIFINKLKQIPKIEMVSLGNIPAMYGYSTQRVSYFNGTEEIQTDANRRSVDENYIDLFGLNIIAGRNVVKSDTIKEVIVNETYARSLGFENPQDALGEFLIFNIGGPKLNIPIIGIVSDFHLQSLHQPIKPLFISSGTNYESIVNVKLNSIAFKRGELKDVLASMKIAYEEVYTSGNIAFEPRFFDETIAKFYAKEERFSQILNAATAIAIIISCLGLFGLVAFTTKQRTKEIGIRKVLGASVGRIVAVLSTDFLRLVIFSILIASPIAYYFMNQWLQDFAYRMSINGWIFALAGIIAISIALITVSYQSIKAALENPVNSLRSE